MPDAVKFCKVNSAQAWAGNGFAPDGADWVALVGDVVVGMWDGGMRKGDVLGDKGWPLVNVSTWKRTVRQQVASGV